MIEIFGTIATVIAVGGVWLNCRMNLACFYLWIVSNSISAGIHVSTGPVSLIVRDLIFLALAFHGLREWKRKRKNERDVND